MYSNLISLSEVCVPDSSNMIRHRNHVGECQILPTTYAVLQRNYTGSYSIQSELTDGNII